MKVVDGEYFGRHFAEDARFGIDAGLNLDEIGECQESGIAVGVDGVADSESVALGETVGLIAVGPILSAYPHPNGALFQ